MKTYKITFEENRYNKIILWYIVDENKKLLKSDSYFGVVGYSVRDIYNFIRFRFKVINEDI